MEIYKNYFVRQPAFKLNVINDIYNSENLKETVLRISESNEFKERLLIASKSLYLEFVSRSNQDLNQVVLMSLVKYILRMSSRPMPIGLLSGLNKKSFIDNENKVHMNTNHKKLVRPSIQWLNQVVEIIEQNQLINSELNLYWNSLVRKSKGYLYLDVPSIDGQDRIEIRENSFITNLSQLIDSKKNINEILEYFADLGSSKQKTLSHLKTLLKKNILVSNLRLSSNNKKNFSLDKLLFNEEIIDNNLLNKLHSINDLIEKYENYPIGEGIDIYFKIEEKMCTIAKVKNYLIVDLQLYNDEKLSKEEVSFLEDISFLNLFKTVSPYYNAWERYRERFWDKYGLFNEINLLELLDEDTGIGGPIFNENPEHLKMLSSYNEFLSSKFQECIILNKTNVLFEKSDIQFLQDLTKYNGDEKIKDGFDIKFSQLEEGDVKKFLFSENSFSSTVFSFTGRFNIDNNEEKSFKYTNDNYISAELNVIPGNYPDLGVSNYLAEFQIDMHGHLIDDKEGVIIPLNDILVGMDYQGMYVKSKSLNKKLLPVTTHMLFYSNFDESKPLLFLSQFGDYISNTPKDFYLGIGEKLPFVPRIEYKNLILSLKRWNITTSPENGLTVKEHIKEFIKKYDVEKTVNLLLGDRKLPIRTDTNLGIELIAQEFKIPNLDYITLVEAPELDEKYIYNKDFIISVLPDKNSILSDTKEVVNNSRNLCNLESETKVDFNWIYYKIYYKKGKRIETTMELIKKLKECNFEDYFIVNYVDSHEHIRLRYKENENSLNFEEEIITFVKNNNIKSYSKDVFIPEISRYGEVELYQNAYDLFCLETQILHEMESRGLFRGKSNLQKGIMVTIYTIMDLFENYDEGLQFFDILVMEKNKERLKDFSSNRRVFLDIGKEILVYQLNLGHIHTEKRCQLRDYVRQVKGKFQEERVNYILLSLVHMTINRFMGVDRELENMIYEYTKYVFYNLGYTIKNQGELELYV
ncbi:thiopeptide-type bacteriocin biosynthesis protein [Lysinibacillus fusiformis]|uniref:thiopeptide-type bacteriocin biosynthesis protein n=1 Tax=Lysinibacillus fusiformis TaxID=28031 RepID=UPI003CFF1973